LKITLNLYEQSSYEFKLQIITFKILLKIAIFNNGLK